MRSFQPVTLLTEILPKDFDEPGLATGVELAAMTQADIGARYALQWGQPVTLRVVFDATLTREEESSTMTLLWDEVVRCEARVTADADGVTAVEWEAAEGDARRRISEYNDDERTLLEGVARDSYYQGIEAINR